MGILPAKDQSYWRDIYPPAPLYPSVSQDMETDVIVVGAGITGLTAAYLLKKSDLRVIVLDKDTVGGGTTGRTTGKVTSQHGLIYADMVKRLGMGAARAYAEANQSAVQQVRDIIGREQIDCDWRQDDSYVFTAHDATTQRLQDEAKIALELGLPASYESHAPLPFEIRGAVKFADQGVIHSQKYLMGLATAVHGGGSYVYEHSRVWYFRDDDQPYVRVGDATIRAKHIVVATKVPTYPLAARFTYGLKEYPTESYGIACELHGEMLGMYISPDHEHHSILPMRDGDRQILIVVGAGGNIPGVRLSKKKRYETLHDYTSQHFAVGPVLNTWSDMDYLPYDLFPLVGKVYSWSKHLYTATGFMKWGLSNGTAAALMLRDMIVGAESNAWRCEFRSTRLRPLVYLPGALARQLFRRR